MIYNLKISKPLQKNNIVVFFLKTSEMNDHTYLNLNGGLSKNKVGIEEYDDVGYRDLLKIKNLSDESLLLLNGEQIIGHKIKQNRVVASTSLIAENSEGIIPCFCASNNSDTSGPAFCINLSILVALTEILKKPNLDEKL